MPFVCRTRLEDMLDEDAAPRACMRIADAAGDRLETLTKRFTPVDRSVFRDRPDRPRGTARDSVHRTPVEVRVRVRGVRYVVKVQTFDPVFPYIEFNTRPHIITARTAKALRIPTGGGPVFRKTVRHPGTTGQHPFARAALQVSGEIEKLADRPLDQFGRELTARIR